MQSEEVTSNTDNIVKPKNKFSWSEGIDLYLLHDQTRVCVNVSSWSGFETIYINGERAFRKWNLLSRNSVYNFSDNNIEYVIQVRVENFFKGEISATLHANKQQVDHEKLVLEDWFEKNRTP